MKPHRVRLFVKPYCGCCHQAIAWLDRRGVAYEKLDVTADGAAWAEMERLSGQTLAPVVQVDGRVLADFGIPELAYWNLSNGSRVNMEHEGVLPGDGKTGYLKAPAAVMLMAAPLIGLVFAVFLPFIGIEMTLSLIGKKLVGGVASAAAGSMSFGWRPIEAYLAGRKRRKEVREKKSVKESGKQ